MVKDKINYRATGKRNVLTRQTNQGRANDGGLRIGEMERDGIMAHGLSYFLNESYMVRGDQYYMGICNNTGAIAIYNPDAKLFLSPFVDGPIGFTKNVEGKDVLNAISKFGRSFSIVRIPYALKLLIHELIAMNVHMRIITEDNVDQIMNLSYQSKNIDKLLHIDNDVEIMKIIQDYKTSIERKLTGITNVIEKQQQMDFGNDTTREDLIAIIKNKYGRNVMEEGIELTNEQLLKIIDNHERMNKIKEWEETKKQGLIDENGNIINDKDEFLQFSNRKGYNEAEGKMSDDHRDINKVQELARSYINPEIVLYFSDENPEFPFQYYNAEKAKWIQISVDLLNYQNNLSKKFGRKVVLEPSNSKKYRFMEEEGGKYNYYIPSYYYMDKNKNNETKKNMTYVDNPFELSGRSPLEPPPLFGGGNNLFDDENMNNVFNRLSEQNKTQIMMLEPSQQYSVVKEIMRRTPATNNGSNILDGAFKALPLDKQFIALQGGYNSMAKEFNVLAKTTPDPLVTINNPVPVSQQISNAYPILAVSEDEREKTEISESSPGNNASDTVDDGTIKIKKLM